MPDEKQKPIDDALVAEVPTYYANNLSIGISPYDLSMIFALRVRQQAEPQARVIMSLEHALVMTMVLRRVLREHVRSTGVTPKIPQNVMRDLQLDEEEPLW